MNKVAINQAAKEFAALCKQHGGIEIVSNIGKGTFDFATPCNGTLTLTFFPPCNPGMKWSVPWVAGRFADVELAKARYVGLNLNPYSGKWNWHNSSWEALLENLADGLARVMRKEDQ